MQFIPGDETACDAWLLSGECVEASEVDVWAAIQRALSADPDAPCMTCDGAGFSRAQVLAAVRGVSWTPGHLLAGIHVARSPAAVIATLAAWMNGTAYVPVASDYPPARVATMALACRLDVVISDRPLDIPGYRMDGVQVVAGTRLLFHVRAAARTGTAPVPEPADAPAGGRLCYIAHTSGSTGDPKGVRISHASLLNRIGAMRRFLEVGPQDRFLYKTSAVFDVHVWEFVLPLVAGCPFAIYRQEGPFDLRAVAAIMVQTGVTIVGFVPALLKLLVQLPRLIEGNALRAILCGGEAWGPPLARAVFAALPGRALFNSYGPAETTIAVTNWRVPDDPDLAQICLGAPLQNTLFLIEQTERLETDSGPAVIGQLAIGGVQVSLGYVDRGHDPDRFFCRVIDGVPRRFYATGDLVRLEVATGALSFQGRADNQVKVNGVRIELEEVEEAVCAVEGVESCVAFVTRRGIANQLGAVFKTVGNRVIGPQTIRDACAAVLPPVLVPVHLRQVSSFPLRENGKVDRAALIRMALQQADPAVRHSA